MLTVLLLAARMGCQAGVLVSIDASPLSIPADGKSRAQVLVTVLDETGAAVRDNTEVRLTTSAGDVTPVLYTAGGRAVGMLTSSSSPQVAIVGAHAAGGSGSAHVQFVGLDGDVTEQGSGTMRMTGGSLAYSADTDTILGSGRVSMDYKGVEIEAVGVQMCQSSGQLRAQGEVSIRRKGRTLTADALAWDIRTNRIGLMDSGDQPVTRLVDLVGLRPVEEHETRLDAQSFLPLTNTSGKSWVVCERLTLIPGDKILFYKASIYVGDAKVVRMPYYSFSYEKRESILQQIRYTSGDGILVDLPVYYQMTDSRTGALKLRYAATGSESGGYSRPRKGLSLGLEHEYSLGENNRGRFFVDALGFSSQAFELSHHMDYGSAADMGRADVYVRYQPSSSYAKSLYNTTLNASGGLGNYTYNVSGYLGGSSVQQQNPLDPESVYYLGQSMGNLRVAFRPRSSIVSSTLGRVSPSLSVGYGNLVDTSGSTASSCLYQSLGFTSSRRWPDTRGMGLSCDGSAALTLTAHGQTGATARVGPGLRRSWAGGTALVRYTLNLQSGVTEWGIASDVHQLGLDLYLNRGRRLSMGSSVSFGLDSGRVNLYSSLNYRPMKNWRIRSVYNLYRYASRINDRDYRYGDSYLKVAVYHPLGAYEIGLAWSPDGRDYGIDRNRHIWLELNGGRF